LDSIAYAIKAKLSPAVATFDTAVVDSLIPVINSLPIGKGILLPKLAEYYKRSGEYARAAACFRDLGLIKRWWYTGGFENQKMNGFLKDFGPESRPFNPKDIFIIGPGSQNQILSYPGRPVPSSVPTKIGWERLINNTDENGMITISNLFVQIQYSAAYFFTYLHVPSAREARFLIGSDDGVRVWLNDTLVWSNKVFRGTYPDNDYVRIHLKQGVNRLLVKIVQDIGGCAMLVRLTDPSGNGMNDVVASYADTLEQNPFNPLLAAMEKNSDAWIKAADVIDMDNQTTQQALLSTIVSEDETQGRRLAALQLLTVFNSRRSIPIGEYELLDLAGKLVAKNDTGPVSVGIIQALVQMNTSAGLDLGLEMRAKPNAAFRRLGDQLVSLYCLYRIDRCESHRRVATRGELQRVLTEVESVQPTDPQVLLRYARLLKTSGDSVKAKAVYASIAISDSSGNPRLSKGKSISLP
jgi:hypothetical protein